MFHEGEFIDVKKCKEILEKNEPQKSDCEKEYIKNILKQTTLFKQFEEEIKFQMQENEDLKQHNSDQNNQREVLDIEILLNRTQRNIKYLRVPINQFLFHKGEVGDRLYMIIKGHAAVYAEREKGQINSDLNKEKNLTKQIQLLTNKILHYELSIEQKEKKILDGIQFEQQLIQQQLQQQQQQQESNDTSDIENKQINLIRKQQRKQEEQALAQLKNTLCELKEELQNYQKQLNHLISVDQQILKQACSSNKELQAKYFTSASTSGNICYYQKLKTLDPFNHLGEASILTNENRTATVMACYPQNPSQSKNEQENNILEEENINQVENEESFQQMEISSKNEEDQDLHLLYLEANVFVSIFSSTLDQINYPLTILSKILNQTSKDLLVRISYLFKLNEYKFNKQIFTEGVDLANCVYLIKRGSIQLQRNARQDELEGQNKNENQINEETENLKNKKKIQSLKRQIVIAVIGEGQFFGLEDISFKKKYRSDEQNEDSTEKVFDKIQKRTCSAVALTNCLVYAVPKNLLLTSSYQFYELQQILYDQSKVKQQFYLNQAKKNNNIQHYMEREMNRIQQEPLIEKAIIQMSMNHHKQMMNGSNKVSNMMDSYIKVNKDVLDNQKSILQMAHLTEKVCKAAKQGQGELEGNIQGSQQTSPTKPNYGKVKQLINRNPAEIIYAHLVQSENEKALNIKENVVLSVMPQSQKNVKDILLAQKNYSKSKDLHNKNIRIPSRQNLNETIFVSQSHNNLLANQQNNNFQLSQLNSKSNRYINSLCELEETQPQQYKIERKNNIIQVKKIKNFKSQNSQAVGFENTQDQEKEDNTLQTQTQHKQIKSLGSTQFSTPLIKPTSLDQEKKFQYLKQIQSSFLELNTPPTGNFQLDATNIPTNNLEDSQEKIHDNKNRAMLLNTKSIDFDSKKSYYSNFLTKQMLSTKNQQGNFSDRQDKSISANQTERSIKQGRLIQLKNDFDNLSSSQNDSFTKSELLLSNSQSLQNISKQFNNQDSIQETQNTENNQKIFQQSIPQRAINKKSSYFKQNQNDLPNSEYQDQKSVHFISQSSSDKKQGDLRQNHRGFSVGQMRKENKYHSPFQIQALQSNQIYKKQPLDVQSEQQQQEENDLKKQNTTQLLQSEKQIKNQKKFNYFLSSSNLDQLENSFNFQQNQSKDQFSQTQFRNKFIRLSNESRFNNTLYKSQKFTPSKNGKLKPLLPLLSPQQIEPPQLIEAFNPFQSRRLQPSRVKFD
ncbi:hypothetical protein TTHERM_00622670 (macronuclear) [Tetrahymena thermophila SB210]|uniref:Cyclic nucleotide-binding domain-containing protein n=1 Tax=Tetrahymena thermophila (strain SB210) TaxID=312017 RepID=Q241B7_TETTS|nr:hypothetical protein TTHERM_00622670 [Tetrahymena thermophila SB210]EAS02247.1 hypothetical protein TTHERM_00622670 [Tetrahymena thermophila SB210]|eukprot:XP_001022492.1 hypothetical protein TTHERM_00622670 [Tetrahymena thermophila SB210]